MSNPFLHSDPCLLSYSRAKNPDSIGKMRSSVRVLLVLGLALALVADSDAFHRRRRRGGRGGRPSGGSNQKRDQKAADAKAADAKAADAKAAAAKASAAKKLKANVAGIHPDCKGRDELCAAGETCVLTGLYLDSSKRYECAKKDSDGTAAPIKKEGEAATAAEAAKKMAQKSSFRPASGAGGRRRGRRRG